MGDIISAARRKSVDEVEYEDLFSELIATVKVPEPLVVTADLVLECPTKDQVEELNSGRITEAEAQKIIFADQYEAAMELFGGRSIFIWKKFMDRYNAHFFGDSDSGK